MTAGYTGKKAYRSRSMVFRVRATFGALAGQDPLAALQNLVVSALLVERAALLWLSAALV